jgi:hypothetical protein
MKQYRKKDAPLTLVPQPKTLTIDGMAVLKSRNDEYTAAQMFAAGYYLDVSIAPTDSQKWSDGFVWDEEAGTVTRQVVAKSAEELAAAITIKRQTASAEIKQLRSNALDKFTKNSSGVLMVYDVNVIAAKAFLAGDTAPLRTGMTPEQHLAMGANMGMTSEQFAYYILSENTRLGPSSWDVENKYLAALMAVSYGPTESIDTVVENYRDFCATVNGN